MVASLGCTGLLLALAAAPQGEPLRYVVRVDAAGVDRRDAPVEIPLRAGREIPAAAFPRSGEHVRARLRPRRNDGTGTTGSDDVPAQIEVDSDAGTLTASWIVPTLDRADSAAYTLTLRRGNAPGTDAAFRFVSGDGQRDLCYGDRPVWREMMLPYDPEDHERTKKTFLHLFDPRRGALLTKGPGGLHSHHRGVFAGWNRTKSPRGTHDFWHCPRGVRVLHREHVTARECAGPVRARGVSRIEWIDRGGTVIVRELRELTAWRQSPGRVLLDVGVTLESAGDRVELTGDPHHAGVQFRAAQAVADEPDHATYLRPASATGGDNDVWTECAWAASRFAIGGRPQVIVHMDHPDNPRPTSYSTRAYGRFGAFCRATLEPGVPVRLRYRLLLIDAAADPECWDRARLDAAHAAFATPLGITVDTR